MAQQLTQYVQERVSTAGYTARDALIEARSTASSKIQHATASINNPIEQLSILAENARKTRFVNDIKMMSQLPGALASAFTGRGMDDRKMLLEQVVALVSSLPVVSCCLVAAMTSVSPTELLMPLWQRLLHSTPLTRNQNSNASRTLSNALITIIWGDLPHPPTSYLGKLYRFRNLDGSANNIFKPELGASAGPYSRNVTRTQPEPINLPDPGTVFDLLLSRDKFVPHPSGISSLLFAFANIIIHDIFATSGQDASINNHSSYLDLQVVYGANDEENQRVRTGQFGFLKPDAIADWRLVLMPPSTGALAILFSRSHNYIARRILEVNERGRFDNLEGKDLDDELFGIARLVNCGLFLQIILRDYIPTILNLNASEWYVDPIDVISNIGGVGKLARGTGNSVSAEFSVMYRWHAAISVMDENWMNELFSSKFSNKRPEDVTAEEFLMVARTEAETYAGVDPAEWKLHKWQRDSQGKYDDAVLAKVVKDATNEIAGAFKARGFPSWFRPIEILGQIRARETWALCTMNEFRAFLGLKTYSSFSEWNEDTEISRTAERLYGHIDNLELYPGLLAEQPKPSVVGSGLCPGYTISRGILSDAAALTRGDRFYTTDFSTSNLTTYGYEYVISKQHGSTGVLGKLLMSTLPGQFPYNSIFALYPFSVPSKTRQVLHQKGVLDHYDTAYPPASRRWHTITSYASVKEILKSDVFFTTLPRTAYDENAMVAALSSVPRWKEEISEFYTLHTRQLLKQKSGRFNMSGGTRMFDLIELVDTISAQFTANLFALPIREPDAHVGMTPQELHLALARPLAFALAGSYTFLGRQTWRMEEQSETATKTLTTLIRTRLHTVRGIFSPLVAVLQGVSNVIGGPENISPGELAKKFYAQLFSMGKPTEELVKNCFQMMTAMTAIQSLIMQRVVWWFLLEDNRVYLDKIHTLSQKNDPSSVLEFRENFFEACRLSSNTPPPPRFVISTIALPEGKEGQIQLQIGDGVYISPSSVYRDPSVYENPDAFNSENHYPLSFGLGDRPTQLILQVVLPAMARQIFKLQNLRMAPSGQPQMVTDAGPIEGGERLISYVSSTGQENPLPLQTAMHVLYDGDIH